MNLSIFQQHIHPIQSKLFRFALRITGNSHAAEDVVQEVLEKVWKTPEDQSNAVQNWEAWCMTLTRNRSIDHSRANQKHGTTPLSIIHETQSDHTTPAQMTETNDMIAQVKNFIQMLPVKQRMVMHLRDIEEMTYEEIAESLEMPMDQVKVNLHRARKFVRDKITNLA